MDYVQLAVVLIFFSTLGWWVVCTADAELEADERRRKMMQEHQDDRRQ